MKKLIAVTLVAAGTLAASAPAALAQGYIYYGAPAGYIYSYGPAYGLYDYAPGYATTYGYYAPDHWYGSYDESGNSVRQPNPRSTIRAVR
jgi:hypothetical protein